MTDYIVREGDVGIRPMLSTEGDFAHIVRWRNSPHVRQWWEPDDPPMTLDGARKECGPSIDGADPTSMCIIEWDGRPIGFVQYYPWAAYEEDIINTGLTVPDGAWSLDIFIGEPEAMGRGIGSRVVRMVCDHLFQSERATAIAFGVDRDNTRAQRAYEKAGMTRTIEYLDTDTRDGVRTWAILMVRTAGT